jgi:hypothetical protein
MREIKFRAFGKSGKMHYWSLNDCQSGWVAPDEKISDLMQWTGLKFNDVDVYEGDLIQINRSLYIILYEVIWDSSKGQFSLIHARREGDKYGVYTRTIHLNEDKKVAGNIHEHPHLLNTSAS